jgi:Uma2 family endonuclease
MRFMKATSDPRVTFAELQQWPDDGRRYELYDGEVIVVPSPFLRHQRVASHIIDILTDYESAIGGMVVQAPFDIVFSEHNVLQPDCVFFRKERRHLLHDWEATRAAPDLAVEVLSRSTEARDRGRKKDILARFGVGEYWIVDPSKNTFEIHVLRGSDYELTGAYDERDGIASPTLSGLRFPAARVFAE